MQVSDEEETRAICQTHLDGIVKTGGEQGMQVRACNGVISDDQSTILKVVCHSGRWIGVIINMEAKQFLCSDGKGSFPSSVWSAMTDQNQDHFTDCSIPMSPCQENYNGWCRPIAFIRTVLEEGNENKFPMILSELLDDELVRGASVHPEQVDVSSPSSIRNDPQKLSESPDGPHSSSFESNDNSGNNGSGNGNKNNSDSDSGNNSGSDGNNGDKNNSNIDGNNSGSGNNNNNGGAIGSDGNNGAENNSNNDGNNDGNNNGSSSGNNNNGSSGSGSDGNQDVSGSGSNNNNNNDGGSSSDGNNGAENNSNSDGNNSNGSGSGSEGHGGESNHNGDGNGDGKSDGDSPNSSVLASLASKLSDLLPDTPEEVVHKKPANDFTFLSDSDDEHTADEDFSAADKVREGNVSFDRRKAKHHNKNGENQCSFNCQSGTVSAKCSTKGCGGFSCHLCSNNHQPKGQEDILGWRICLSCVTLKKPLQKEDSPNGGEMSGEPSKDGDDGEGSAPPEEKKRQKKTLGAMVSEARNTEPDGGQLSGEPSKGFMDFMARILPKGIHMDLGSGAGIYLFELSKRRRDLTLAGIEIRLNRHNIGTQLHQHAQTGATLSNGDIKEMEEIPDTITSVWMHDTVWTEDVVVKSTDLILQNASIVTVVCVKARPELTSQGVFQFQEEFQFTLRGGGNQRTALVYVRAKLESVQSARTRVVEITRAHFKEDSASYLGDTEDQKKKDMQVRYRLLSPVIHRVLIVGIAGQSDRWQVGRRSRVGLFSAYAAGCAEDCCLGFQNCHITGMFECGRNEGRNLS